jgi:hypothetical protein
MSEDIQQTRNIRDLIGHLIGQRLVDITQPDEDEEGDHYDELMFEKGNTVKFFFADSEAYEGGFPMCFSDPNREDDDGFYHPDPEAVEAHKWAAVGEITPKGEILHAIPCFGKLHHIGETCNCHPQKGFRDDGSWYFTHEEMKEETNGANTDHADER